MKLLDGLYGITPGISKEQLEADAIVYYDQLMRVPSFQYEFELSVYRICDRILHPECFRNIRSSEDCQ